VRAESIANAVAPSITNGYRLIPEARSVQARSD
jgi:hypothetical protein